MELQFPKSTCDCLRWATWEVKNEEHTQEVRLPDAMPDIGKVLGTWGQVLIRSKEWRSAGMSISGGIMAWILYEPEGGGQPESIESWIPFQMRWDFPETRRDGSIVVNCLLRSMDARSVSARKLMVRAAVSVAGTALEPTQLDVYAPVDMPDDVCILRTSYPVCIPREAGERTFSLEETVPVPATCADMERIIHYALQPEIVDGKVMGDKAVFRGTALVRMLCRTESGELKACSFEVPFSQYTQLEREYQGDATVCVVPAVTNLELEKADGEQLSLKAGMIGQYVVYDNPVIEVVSDAYSPRRSVALQMQELPMPAVLEMRRETIRAEKRMEKPCNRVVDISFGAEHPAQRRREDGVQMEQPGTFQLLYYDAEGMLQNETMHWENTWDLPAEYGTGVQATAGVTGGVQAAEGGASTDMRADMFQDILTTAQAGIPMVSALQLGEMAEPDPSRPSLIVRRAGNQTLWEIAKQCASTVEAIQQANELTQEPLAEQVLLIPVN